MKTLEEVNGQKVWAADVTHGCDGCMFKDNPTTSTCSQCCDDERPDKRNVIFLPYEEEKTFTLSQINEVIDEMYNNQTTNPYFEAGRRNALVVLKQKLEQL